MAGKLQGKTVFITGAASGIGAASARWCAAEGASTLVLLDRDMLGMQSLDLPCTVKHLHGDVSDPALWGYICSSLDGIDAAVIAAGIVHGSAISDTDFADWRKVMAVNLDGAFLALRGVLRAMKPQAKGSIVTVASATGIKVQSGIAAYGTSKAALLHLTRLAAKEAAEYGVRVNAIAPGGVDTPLWDSAPFFNDAVAKAGDRAAVVSHMAKTGTPLERWATADEIAAQIGFLLSDDSINMTGSTLVSDGGYTL